MGRLERHAGCEDHSMAHAVYGNISPIGPPAVGPNVTPSSYVRDLSTTEKWDLAMRIARRVYVKDGRLAIGDSPPLLWAGGASAVRCDATTMHCYDGGWRHLLVLTGPTGKTVSRGSVSREEGERLRRADASAAPSSVGRQPLCCRESKHLSRYCTFRAWAR